MKKTYAFLLTILAVALFGFAGSANAQYTIASYNVIANGDAWTPLSGGTDIPEITPNNTYAYDRISNEITLPFTFRYINTITNKIKVTQQGSVIVGGSDQVPDGVAQYNSFYGACYQNSFFGTYGQFLNGQQNYGSPVYAIAYPNNTIHPWVGYQTAVVGSSKFSYLVEGTAPFRRATIEALNRQNIYQNTTGSWQVVIYEGSSFISKIKMNYGPQSVPGQYWYNYGYSIGMGLKSTGGSGGYLSVIRDPQPAVGNAPTYSTTTCYDVEYSPLPTVNYVYSILYDYNLAWSNPQISPADATILLINNPFSPQARLTNEGRFNFSSASVRCVIQKTTDVSPIYDQTLALSGGQIPTAFAAPGTLFSMPSFTPTSYGVYNMTFSIASSSPADQYAPDNTITTQFIVSPPNNVASIISMLPAPNSRTPVGFATPVTFRYRNLGVNNQNNVPVSVYITNPQGSVVYRDTLKLNNWLSSQYRDTTFKDFIPTQNGTYQICGVTQLVNDQNSLDDTVCNPFDVRFLSDVKAAVILDPDDLGEKPERKPFKVVAQFQNIGVQDLFDVPARLQIRSCATNALVFQADSVIPEMNTDQGLVKFSFPSKVGNTFDVATLPPGCYKACAIARQFDDGDRSNDTVCQIFSIIPRLQGDIEVGVGRRFTTISAAVDSMRYRGVGPGNLNLILTDQNYTENGATSVSGVNSAVEFRDISGPGPTTLVTWKPKFNVSPTITFTGSKPICFMYSYKSANYITWNGNNQLVPSADDVNGEPGKRNITIVNASSVPGSVFAMEYGRTNLTFKNLNVINNGNLTNVNSNGFRMTNLYTSTSFLGGITDTTENHHIVIDNCFIGNANTGIYNVGSTPMFDVGNAFYLNRRNNNNRITRNTIGSQANPIGALGIFAGNEDGLVVERNEISWITGASTTAGYSAGIAVNSGNSVNLLLNGNKIHNIKAPSFSLGLLDTVAGIEIRQASTIYVTGSGSNAKLSTLPVNTGNRITNNFIYDLRRPNTANIVMPISDSTIGSTSYSVRNDSVFNNSIAVADAQYAVRLVRVQNAFVWNNILQNLNTTANASSVLYRMTLPRPWTDNVSSNYNLIDFRNASQFANITEYDLGTGIQTKTRLVKDANEWRTLTQQDIYSVGGDPRFTTDSLHLPIATTYIPTAASNAGAFLNTATQLADIDGDLRLVGGSAPDIGADEFEGFQYTNDLSVMTITKPSGLADATGTIFVTAENPLAIQGIVKNLGSLTAANRVVTAQVDVSTNSGGTWTPMSTSTLTTSFAVNEAKTLDFVGPVITNETGKLYRVTVFVGNDQNNPNNSVTKIFKILVKRNATLLSYNSATAKGLQNRDSLSVALTRLGVTFDLLDRNAYTTQPVDYSPWWTMVWATGDPNTAYSGVSGVGAVSQKESEEIISFLKAGQTYAKKSFVIAGQNVAQYNDTTSIFRQVNNVITDNDFMTNYMHTRFVARFPGLNWPTGVPTSFRGELKGTGVYFTFPDSILAGSPDVIKPTPTTGVVGSNTSRFAYTYGVHPSTPTDSGAGSAWNGDKFNVVFYAFDWADPLQTNAFRDGQISPINVSGTTRFLRGALDFIKSFGGTVLPVEFTDVKASALTDGNLVSWSVASQTNVDHYEIETLEGNNWNWIGDVKSANANNYSFLHTAANVLAVGQSFSYHVVAVDLDGSRNTSKTVNVERTATGLSFTIEQNSPNPFTSSTVIGYTLPENGTVALRVLDLTGKVITVGIDNESMTAGTHSFKFNANSLATGTYIYEISFTNANGETSVLRSKMTLTK